MNEKNAKEFAERFEKETFPIIKGKDGKGLIKFKRIVEVKKEEVRKRQLKRS